MSDMVTVLQSVQQASQLWSGYDWTGKQSEQDAVLTVSKEHRDSSLAARNVLADTTTVSYPHLTLPTNTEM